VVLARATAGVRLPAVGPTPSTLSARSQGAWSPQLTRRAVGLDSGRRRSGRHLHRSVSGDRGAGRELRCGDGGFRSPVALVGIGGDGETWRARGWLDEAADTRRNASAAASTSSVAGRRGLVVDVASP